MDCTIGNILPDGLIKILLNRAFLCPQRNVERHIVTALSICQSVRPASCPVHISYILLGRNPIFGVWMAACRVPFRVTETLSLTSDLVLRIFVSGAYLLYSFR